MEWGFVLAAFLGALAGSVVAYALTGAALRRRIDERLGAFETTASRMIDAHAAGAAGFGDIAPELVGLVRSATDAAMRREEVNEWHRPSLNALGSDDISESIRGRIRRAQFEALTARTALQGALRKHRAAIPAELDAELRSFVERLESNGDGSSAAAKRRLSADLDAIEGRIRESLSAKAAD